MGGSAFTTEKHGFATSRMNEAQYTTTCHFILPFLQQYFHIVSVAPHPPGKLSYGDLDVMVAQPLHNVPNDVRMQRISEAFGTKCKGIIYNSPTTNFAVAIADLIVQVDVHVVWRDDLWYLDYWFHSYGDMAMIVSTTVKPSGLRLSSTRGLWVEILGHGPFILSSDIERIVRFFGLDWQHYLNGFETVTDIFEWIEGITLNGEKIGRKGRRKHEKSREGRPMWKEYWSQGVDLEYMPTEEEKGQILQEALNYFEKRKEYEDVIKQLTHAAKAKEKLNGNRIMEWTGAKGRMVGDLMKALRADERLAKKNLIDMDDEEIESIVMEYWKAMSDVNHAFPH